tara:strand:+ start:334 stop:642 length:309 start_codon:yes stop_codon:yes gene_type:complete
MKKITNHWQVVDKDDGSNEFYLSHYVGGPEYSIDLFECNRFSQVEAFLLRNILNMANITFEYSGDGQGGAELIIDWNRNDWIYIMDGNDYIENCEKQLMGAE